MHPKIHKTIAAVLNAIVIFGTFQALIAILNLNQEGIYFRTAFVVGLFYILQILLLYDLHYKNRGAWVRAKARHENISHKFHRYFRIWTSAFWDRIEHLRQWKFLRDWLNYLIVPGIVFWASISIFYIHFGFPKVQQVFAALSSIALFLHYYYIKELFERRLTKVDGDIFVVLSTVKIYASAIMYGAALAWTHRYCLDSSILEIGTFVFTFLLIYQALHQHRLVTPKNLSITILISLVMSQLSRVILVYWGYNNFTAAVVLATCYNFMWGIFHYKLDKALSIKALIEILLVSLVILAMVFGVTNFKAKLIDECRYTL